MIAGLGHWSDHVRVDGERITVTLSSEADVPAISRHLVKHGAEVYAIKPQTLSLEELFMRVVGTEPGLVGGFRGTERPPIGRSDP